MIRKGLAVCVILLFIGVAVAPSINAKTVEDEFIEITTEFCGISNTNSYTITMTKNDYKELECLLKKAQINIGQAESLEEASEIVNTVVLELNKADIFSKDDIIHLSNTISKKIESIQTMDEFSLKGFDNLACFIIGKSDRTVALNPLLIGCVLGGGFYIFRQAYIKQFFETYFPDFYEWYSTVFNTVLSTIFKTRLGFWIALGILSNFFPIDILSIIHFGTLYFDYWGLRENPARGNITTFGLKGKKDWNGKIWGTALGFTGIRIQTYNESINNLYVGFALGIYIDD